MKNIMYILMACLLIFTGCADLGEGENTNPENNRGIRGTDVFGGEAVGHIAILRDCGGINVGSYSIDKLRERLPVSIVSSEKYLLCFTISDQHIEEMQSGLDLTRSYGVTIPEEDRDMVDSLIDFIVKKESEIKKENESTKAILWQIEYRTEELVGLKVTANKPIFGREEGEDLSDKFEMYRTLGNSERSFSQFYFTYDKKLVTESVEGKSINDFLAKRPMAPAHVYLRLKETPQEAPIAVSFTVSVTIKGKEPFTDTTKTITLTK